MTRRLAEVVRENLNLPTEGRRRKDESADLIMPTTLG
jgi:hypothetical protein